MKRTFTFTFILFLLNFCFSQNKNLIDTLYNGDVCVFFIHKKEFKNTLKYKKSIKNIKKQCLKQGLTKEKENYIIEYFYKRCVYLNKKDTLIIINNTTNEINIKFIDVDKVTCSLFFFDKSIALSGNTLREYVKRNHGILKIFYYNTNEWKDIGIRISFYDISEK